MQTRLGIKVVLIGALLIALLLPLGMLEGLVAERQERAQEVAADIARSSSRPQTLLGPLRQLRYQREVSDEVSTTENGQVQRRISQRTEHQAVLQAAELTTVDVQFQFEMRSRGLFQVPIYHSRQQVHASFVAALPPRSERSDSPWTLVASELIVGVGDSRGIAAIELTIDGHSLAATPGTGLAWWQDGVAASLPREIDAGAAVTVDLELSLGGTETIAWVPLANEYKIGVRGDWPHPSFFGSFLPQSQHIDGQGFSAKWQVSALASRTPQALLSCPPAKADCAALTGTHLGVRLLQPVDRYLMTDRALKYALLFLGLTFGAVFLIETLRGLDLHLVQYGLTGLALAIFYLLLLALSEHLAFGLAYLIAASACCGLLVHYLSAVLGGRIRGIAFGVGLAGLYALLFAILQSEDFALLTGSLALFALLSVAMTLTRRIDWRAARS